MYFQWQVIITFTFAPLLIKSLDNNRSQLIKTKNNTIIADCYNANPTSTMEALRSFKDLENENKLVILGDM